MKRHLFLLMLVSCSLGIFSQEVYAPGEAAVVEMPVSGIEASRKTPSVSGLAQDLSRPQICYVKRVSLVRKGGADYVSLEIIPWLEGENAVPPFTVNGKKIGEFAVKAELETTELYVPQPKPMLEHEGLGFRLLLYLVSCLCICAAAGVALGSRKRLLAYFRLRYGLALSAGTLGKRLRAAEKARSWSGVDKAVRAYVETATELFASQPVDYGIRETIRARSLTAEELGGTSCGQDSLKAEIVSLLAMLERVRWGGSTADFRQCLETSLRLPSLFRERLFRKASAEGASSC